MYVATMLQPKGLLADGCRVLAQPAGSPAQSGGPWAAQLPPRQLQPQQLQPQQLQLLQPQRQFAGVPAPWPSAPLPLPPWGAVTLGVPAAPPVPVAALSPVAATLLRPHRTMTATMFFDGEQMEIRYGPNEDYESPEDFFTPCPSEWRGPYAGMLELLGSHRWLQELDEGLRLVDREGVLRVSLPFCGSVQELPVLAAFLAERFLNRPGVRTIRIMGSDIDNWNLKGGYWHQKGKFFSRKYTGMQVEFRQLDLSKEAHPDSMLMFGMHPECTVTTSPWPRILANVIRATKGICVIATFKEGEMEVVRDICVEMGTIHEVHMNPYWSSHPLPQGTIPPFLQYLVLIRGALQ